MGGDAWLGVSFRAALNRIFCEQRVGALTFARRATLSR
jgi:hypothetical protein